MTLGDGVFAYLSATLSVGDRVYPLTLPQGAVLPAVVYQLVGGEGPLHSHADAHDGQASAGSSYQRFRVQLGCWADSAGAAEVLATEVERAVEGFTGSWGEVPIAAALVELAVDDYRPDVGRCRLIIGVLVCRVHDLRLLNQMDPPRVIPGEREALRCGPHPGRRDRAEPLANPTREQWGDTS